MLKARRLLPFGHVGRQLRCVCVMPVTMKGVPDWPGSHEVDAKAP